MLRPQKALSSVKPNLTSTQLKAKLEAIPGFIIIDPKGVPLTATIDRKAVVGVFLRRSEAESFLAEIKKQRPQLSKMKVFVASVALIQELTQKSGAGVELGYVPDAEELKEAQKILLARGVKGGAQAVPLFLGKVEGQGYLTLKQKGVDIIPLYFSRRELQVTVDRYNQTRKSGAPAATIEVAFFEQILSAMRTTSDPLFPKMLFFPSQEALAEAKALGGKKP